MAYILGVVTGILVSALVFLVELYLKSKNASIIQRCEELVPRSKKEGSIILPLPEAVRSMEEKVKRNNSLGKDTDIDEILQD